jgi:uncharacterized protein YuzE
MKIYYDRQFDILYMVLIEKELKDLMVGDEIEPGVILHKTEHGEIAEIEIHYASKKFPKFDI